ncbi:hypothetical protein ACOZ4L_05050 [Haloplanus ruber]|uniref:Uncharacterized protein n=1 Tax=Haloplanus ruber TaxID=869892 RepID=A0ABD6D1M9_9EURY|nr:hypothetical protein [Haloplanus ruber]
MSSPSPIDKYDTVSEAEDDIHRRIDLIPNVDEWLLKPLAVAVMPTWTDALTSFSAKSRVTRSEAAALDQIESLYQNIQPLLQQRSELLGSGTMDTLEESHVLFIVLFRDLQRETGERANMNPHKLRVLLDGRYTIK